MTNINVPVRYPMCAGDWNSRIELGGKLNDAGSLGFGDLKFAVAARHVVGAQRGTGIYLWPRQWSLKRL